MKSTAGQTVLLGGLAGGGSTGQEVGWVGELAGGRVGKWSGVWADGPIVSKTEGLFETALHLTWKCIIFTAHVRVRVRVRVRFRVRVRVRFRVRDRISVVYVTITVKKSFRVRVRVIFILGLGLGLLLGLWLGLWIVLVASNK